MADNKNDMTTYRTNGAIGALLDEYERAIKELNALLNEVSATELLQIADPNTEDVDCRSIQTILSHVVRAGYNYVIAIRNSLGESLAKAENVSLDNTKDYQVALESMFLYNEALFDDYPDLKLEEYDPEKKILVSWGQRYDTEQLLEHAIVHILRHRRQISRFLLKMRG